MPQPATITAARIEKISHPWVMIGTINGLEERLFSYFSDELRFTPEEVVGLTEDQAADLHRQRDIAYLRS